jgi:hypothetical protein
VDDLPDVPLVAFPKHVLGVDGADEKLEHEFPMANSKQNVVGCAKDIVCQCILSPVCEQEHILNNICKCRKTKKEQEHRQIFLRLFNQFSSNIAIGKKVDQVE